MIARISAAVRVTLIAGRFPAVMVTVPPSFLASPTRPGSSSKTLDESEADAACLMRRTVRYDGSAYGAVLSFQ